MVKQQCIHWHWPQSSSAFCAKSMENALNVSVTFVLVLFGLPIFVFHSVSAVPVCVLQMIEDVLGEGPVSASRFSQWFSSNMSPSGSRSSSLRSTPHEELEKLAGKFQCAWFYSPNISISLQHGTSPWKYIQGIIVPYCMKIHYWNEPTLTVPQSLGMALKSLKFVTNLLFYFAILQWLHIRFLLLFLWWIS